jgi:hypothetical protein
VNEGLDGLRKASSCTSAISRVKGRTNEQGALAGGASVLLVLRSFTRIPGRRTSAHATCLSLVQRVGALSSHKSNTMNQIAGLAPETGLASCGSAMQHTSTDICLCVLSWRGVHIMRKQGLRLHVPD